MPITANESSRLGSADWTSAALSLLLEQGVDAVQITRLAKVLGVTRGSFYWHFAGRDALLESMIAAWQSANSSSVQDALNSVDSLSKGVLEFFALWVDGSRFSPQLEQAVRDWARLDVSVMQAVRREDIRRIKIISRLFKRFDYPPDDALVRARILYFAQIGYYALHRQESMKDRLKLLDCYFVSFTGQSLDPRVAKQFSKRFEVHR